MKVLLNSFHLNGHTLGLHPQTKKLEPHYFFFQLVREMCMKELWSSLERNMQTRNCFLLLGNLKKTAKRYCIDAATRMILRGPYYH